MEARERVEKMVQSLMNRIDEDELLKDGVEIWWDCPLTHYDHDNENRVYAHTGHIEDVICVHSALLELPLKYQWGIMAHEVGHLIAFQKRGEHEEDDADKAVARHLGLTIFYDEDFKDIEYLDDEDLASLRKHNPDDDDEEEEGDKEYEEAEDEEDDEEEEEDTEEDEEEIGEDDEDDEEEEEDTEEDEEEIGEDDDDDEESNEEEDEDEDDEDDEEDDEGDEEDDEDEEPRRKVRIFK